MLMEHLFFLFVFIFILDVEFTTNPPQIQFTKRVPKYGIADKRLVITVAPQKDICPQGRTYPIKAVAINKNKIISPTIQV